jgi:hypothetical protein
LALIGKPTNYRTSLQMGLWRKSTLQELIDPEETPWQFEIEGSLRSTRFGDRFLAVTKPKYGIQYTFTAVERGYWSQKAFLYAQEEGIEIDFAALSPPSITKQARQWFKRQLYRRFKYWSRSSRRMRQNPGD